MKRARTVLLSAALCLTLTAQPARALNPGAISGASDILKFIDQLKEWMGSINQMVAMKDDLFGQINVDQFSGLLNDTLSKYGIDAAGIDMSSFMGLTDQFQGQIDAIRDQIMNEINKITGFTFGNGGLDFMSQFPSDTPAAFNPVLDQQRYQGTKGLYEAGEDQEARVQANADSAKTVEEVKKIVDETVGRSDQTNKNAAEIVTDAAQIQSTREGIELLIRTQAEAITSSTYSATALTSAIAQQVQQTEVTNRTLDTVAQDIIDERSARAQAMIGLINQRQEIAQESQDRLKSTFDNAANGIGKTFEVVESDIDASDMF